MDSIKEILKKPKTRKIFEEMANLANLNIENKNIEEKINSVTLKLYSLTKDIINTLPNLSEKKINESIEKILINKELDEKTKNKLKFYINNLFNNSNSKKGGDPTDEEDDKCPICLEPLNNMSIKTCSNGHKFHSECIEEWMNIGNNTCPTCRQPLNFRTRFGELIYIRNSLFLILVIVISINIIIISNIINENRVLNEIYRLLPSYIITILIIGIGGMVYNANAFQIQAVIFIFVCLVLINLLEIFFPEINRDSIEFQRQQNIIIDIATNRTVSPSPYLQQHREIMTQYSREQNDPNLQRTIHNITQVLEDLYNSIGRRGGKKSKKRKTKKRNINKRKKINKKSKTLRK